jgi:4'-phosphopantetheinyl transferase
VDIEQVRDNIEMTELVDRFFSAGEKEAWHSLLESQRKEAFFNAWTRKEAFTKATGAGLAMPLDSFDVSMVPGEPARLLGIDSDEKAAAGWSMQDIKPATGFAAALAMEGKIGTIDLRYWAS